MWQRLHVGIVQYATIVSVDSSLVCGWRDITLRLSTDHPTCSSDFFTFFFQRCDFSETPTIINAYVARDQGKKHGAALKSHFSAVSANQIRTVQCTIQDLEITLCVHSNAWNPFDFKLITVMKNR